MRRDIDALSGQRFDVAVVGGGIHGAWIALRAAQAGHSVALLERGDFGSGTSANSLKILHGGLRYLQHLDFGRMRSSIKARREHARWMPHLFQPLPCVMPLEAGGLRSPWLLGPALLANDCIAFDRNSGVEPGARLPGGRLLSARRCEEAAGGLVRSAAGGALWWDGVARDTARLVLETLHEAVVAGAVVANHAPVERILHSGGVVRGLAFTDELTGRSHELRASRVVNAAGPWTGALAARSGLSTVALPEAWTGALNLVLRRSLGNRCAVAVSAMQAVRQQVAPSRRGVRELFFVPWQDRTMVGTDYVPVESVEAGSNGPPPEAVAGFMAVVDALVPHARIVRDDLALAHWGLMPLERAGDPLPRKSPLILADPQMTGATGLVNVIGEKLTSAPQVAARVMSHLGRAGSARRSTARSFGRETPEPGISAAVCERLRARYGTRWPDVVASSGHMDPSGLMPLRDSAAVLELELQHAIRFEMAQGIGDLLRRTGMVECGHPGAQLLEACIDWGVKNAGWNRDAVEKERQALERRLQAGLVAGQVGGCAGYSLL